MVTPDQHTATKDIPIADALRFGFKTTFQNFFFWLVLFIAIFAIAVVLQLVEHFAAEVSVLLLINMALLQAIYHTMVYAGFIAVAVKFVRAQKVEYSDFICSPLIIGKFFLGYLLYAVIVFVGMLLLIVPGIIWSIKYFPLLYLIVDKNRSPGAAWHESADLTDGVKGQLFLFFVLLLLINFLGMCALFVGLLVTMPTTMLAGAYVYRHLADREPLTESKNALLPGVSPHIQK